MEDEPVTARGRSIATGVILILLGAVMIMAMWNSSQRSISLPVPADPGFAPAAPPYAVNPDPGQLAAFGQSSLTLPMGVTLVGKGYVDSIVSGSPAAQAGVQVGDIINRINGR
jgi:membrane-associated protease RseP (regulator of RpoE activity)